MSTYDIIYSYTCHTEPDAFLDTLRNLYYYNKNINFACILHCNSLMYENIKNKITTFKSLYINDKVWEKTYGTYDILHAQLQNIEFCLNQSFRSRFFIMLASNCLFHKHIDFSIICNQYEKSPPPEEPLNQFTQPMKQDGWFHWPAVYLNHRIAISLLNEGFDKIYKQYHEGLVISFEHACIIYKIANKHNFYNSVDYILTPFEEYIIGTICTKLSGKMLISLCKIFWDLPGYYPSIEQVQETLEPIVKRVHLDFNDPIRIWQRELTNNYSL